MELLYPENIQKYKGIITERDWIFPNVEATGSFFNYWNKGIKQFKS